MLRGGLFIIITCLLIGCSSSDKTRQNRVYFGIDRLDKGTTYSTASLTKTFGKNPHIRVWHLDWEAPFPKETCLDTIKEGSIPMIVWEPWVWQDPDSIQLSRILDGDWDDYIQQWAKQIGLFQYPLFINLAPLFNRSEHPWSISHNDRDPEQYKEVYQYVVNRFKKEGALNVLWVWNPSVDSYPNRDWNNPMACFPGTDVVDWIGLTGVNYGQSQTWSQPRSLEDLFSKAVWIFAKAFPKTPIMLTGFGSVGDSTTKIEFLAPLNNLLLSVLKPVRAIIFSDNHDQVTNSSLLGSENTLQSLVKHDIYTADVESINQLVLNHLEFRSSVLLPSTEKAPVIDGDLLEWSVPPMAQLRTVSNLISGIEYWSDDTDSSVDIWSSWDPEFLYLALRIADDNPQENQFLFDQLTQGDSVEICVSIPETYLSLSKQDSYRIMIPFNKEDSISHWESYSEKPLSQLKHQFKSEKGMATLELGLKWSNFGIAPTKGMPLRLGVVLHDSDVNGDRSALAFNIKGNNTESPQLWGQVILK